MTYVVVRVGQLKEHSSRESAKREAERLVKETGKQFYLAELTDKASPTKVYWASDLEVNAREQWNKDHGYPRNHGKAWTCELDADLLQLYIGCGMSIPNIAHKMERSDTGIRCRLNALGVL